MRLHMNKIKSLPVQAWNALGPGHISKHSLSHTQNAQFSDANDQCWNTKALAAQCQDHILQLQQDCKGLLLMASQNTYIFPMKTLRTMVSSFKPRTSERRRYNWCCVEKRK